jgi:hypothetical protein
MQKFCWQLVETPPMSQPLKSHPAGFDAALWKPDGGVCPKGVPVALQ